MILGRYEQSTINAGKDLPGDWTENFTRTLTEAFYSQSEEDKCFFDVYGRIFDDEFLVIVSYHDQADQYKAPKSLFISHDNLNDTKAFEKALKNLVDLSGMIFDDIFGQKDWNDYALDWIENEFRGSKFHYRITRENISLTLQAEELLKSDGKLGE